VAHHDLGLAAGGPDALTKRPVMASPASVSAITRMLEYWFTRTRNSKSIGAMAEPEPGSAATGAGFSSITTVALRIVVERSVWCSTIGTVAASWAR
jgi:hypothetical protein